MTARAVVRVRGSPSFPVGSGGAETLRRLTATALTFAKRACNPLPGSRSSQVLITPCAYDRAMVAVLAFMARSQRYRRAAATAAISVMSPH